MGSERGSAALGVIGALTLSTLVGVGVYVVIKGQRAAAAEPEASVVHEPPPLPAAVATPPPEPAPEPEPPRAPPESIDSAEASAIDPEIPSGSAATTAPTFGTAGIEGQLDAEDVAAAVRATAARLQRCGETSRAAGMNIAGTLRARLEVNRRGGVTSATTQGINPDLDRCVNGVLRDVRFSRTKDSGTARVVVPIAFQNPTPEPCDEVSCVLNNYDGACCARWKPGAPRPPTNETPDSVSREELHAALDALRAPVNKCAAGTGMTGILRVKFRVLPTGKVGDVTVADVEPELAACITRAFKKHTFTATTNGVSAGFPFKITGE